MNAITMKICFIACLSVTTSIPSWAQESLKSQHSEDLPQTLLTIVKTYHVSVLGEIPNTYPNAITLHIKKGQKIEDTLKALAAQCPGYTWYRRDGVVIFGDKKLLRAPGNPMNIKLSYYKIVGTLSDFKLTFPNALQAAREGRGGVGGLLSGLALPHDLSPSLRTEEFRNLTGREILVRLGAEVGNLYSVLVLPESNSTEPELKNGGFHQWDIAGGPGIATYSPSLSRGGPK